MGVFVAVLVALLLLLAGEALRRYSGLLRRIFLPGSIIAGTIGLLLGPQVLGHLAGRQELVPIPASGLFSAEVIDAWAMLPGVLINVVFAALFIGKPVPGLREIWLRAGPQVVFGQTLAWGQYVVGLLLAILVLAPVFGMNPIAGALIEIGFEGGHGTAAGMAEAFDAAGFQEGGDLALGLATIGLVSGVLIGTVLVNWAARRGHISIRDSDGPDSPGRAQEDPAVELNEQDLAEASKQKRWLGAATDAMSIQLGLIGLAIAVGWLLLEALRLFEELTWGGELFTYVPLFPLAMIGGLVIQLLAERLGLTHLVVRSYIARAGGIALDLTIVAALASLSLQAIGEHMLPFLLLALTGTAWCVFCVLVIAPRVIPYNWFERGIGDFGQSMGMTVSGLLLMRMADPEDRSGAMGSFGYKQLLFEPVVGGGLFTGMSVALIAGYGPWPILALCTALMLAWLVFGLLHFGPLVREERARAGDPPASG
jgi:glutamate:Na+ symporter, ESS family